MKLTVIGQWGGYPKANEASSGYLLEHKGFNLLIDCGSGVLSKMQEILTAEKLHAVILSHYHPDHIADIGVLQHARFIQGILGVPLDPLPIYAHSDHPYEFSKLTYKKITEGKAYVPQKTLKIGPFRVQFLLTSHPVTCYAMRIEADGKVLVYTADAAFKSDFIPFSKDADLLLCECNFYCHQDGRNAGHMNSYDAGILAQSANVKKLVLTHLPHFGNIENLKKESAQKFTGPIDLATHGLTFTL
ncbi:MBL fold metallo-hydrolase [Cytobacillus spongiae]|jgi:ribonuclease BN (tRNA processing enzyme)|uniref:MBL fold metallo-hydrolase n=1 Tax=Cytobacillus spongiae TaxID=2901381 RepID=UPI001F44E1AF|nr:MBL fold metallo-hydrolase [Cytobacillus spongiae]UII56904.1 MBL fold metallo-hydrolase [Cytobacillus spongiae]